MTRTPVSTGGRMPGAGVWALQGYPDDGGARNAPGASTAAEGIAPAAELVPPIVSTPAHRNGEAADGPDRDAVYGALDLGTNNCRLLMARPSRRGFLVIDAFSRIIRLGEGVLNSGQFLHAAMTRTIEALKVCADKIHRARCDARVWSQPKPAASPRTAVSSSSACVTRSSASKSRS